MILMREEAGVPGKTFESGRHGLKLSSNTMIIEVGDVNNDCYTCVTPQGRQNRNFQDGHPSSYQPHPTGLYFGEEAGHTHIHCIMNMTPICCDANKTIGVIPESHNQVFQSTSCAQTK